MSMECALTQKCSFKSNTRKLVIYLRMVVSNKIEKKCFISRAINQHYNFVIPFCLLNMDIPNIGKETHIPF